MKQLATLLRMKPPSRLAACRYNLNEALPDIVMRVLLFGSRVRYPFIIYVLMNGYLSPAYADSYTNTFDNQKICYSIQFAVHQLSPKASSTEWPRQLAIPSISFPVWKELDSKESIDLIQENYVDMVVADRNFDSKLSIGGNHIQPFDQSDLIKISNMWSRLVKPHYLAAISQNSLEFQTAEISGLSNLTSKLVAFRYRIKRSGNSGLGTSGTLLDVDNNWQYIIRIENRNGSFSDYNVSYGITALAGELAILQHSIVLFVTNSSIGPDLAEVYLPPAPFWWAYGGLAISDACPITFSK